MQTNLGPGPLAPGGPGRAPLCPALWAGPGWEHLVCRTAIKRKGNKCKGQATMRRRWNVAQDDGDQRNVVAGSRSRREPISTEIGEIYMDGTENEQHLVPHSHQT
jgi:hypothetical protein